MINTILSICALFFVLLELIGAIALLVVIVYSGHVKRGDIDD